MRRSSKSQSKWNQLILSNPCHKRAVRFRTADLHPQEFLTILWNEFGYDWMRYAWDNHRDSTVKKSTELTTIDDLEDASDVLRPRNQYIDDKYMSTVVTSLRDNFDIQFVFERWSLTKIDDEDLNHRCFQRLNLIIGLLMRNKIPFYIEKDLEIGLKQVFKVSPPVADRIKEYLLSL